MTKSVEAIAELYRQHGWEKQARELEAVVQRFKAEGVPKHFTSELQKDERQEPPYVLRKQWIAILADEKVNPSRPKDERLLTPALAGKLNLVGQKFDDSMPLSVLAVNTKETYTESEDQSNLEREQTYKIDAKIVRPYNKIINTLLQYDLGTVGQIRSINPYGFYRELQARERIHGYGGPRNFSPDSLQFFWDSLKKPLRPRTPTA